MMDKTTENKSTSEQKTVKKRRSTKKLPRITKDKKKKIRIHYCVGLLSKEEVAEKFSITVNHLNVIASQEGWTRGEISPEDRASLQEYKIDQKTNVYLGPLLPEEKMAAAQAVYENAKGILDRHKIILQKGLKVAEMQLDELLANGGKDRRLDLKKTQAKAKENGRSIPTDEDEVWVLRDGSSILKRISSSLNDLIPMERINAGLEYNKPAKTKDDANDGEATVTDFMKKFNEMAEKHIKTIDGNAKVQDAQPRMIDYTGK